MELKDLRLQRLRQYADKHGLVVNDDNAETVAEGLQAKYEIFGVAHCPCIPRHIHSVPDTVCPCKQLRENGVCHCGLFETVK